MLFSQKLLLEHGGSDSWMPTMKIGRISVVIQLLSASVFPWPFPQECYISVSLYWCGDLNSGFNKGRKLVGICAKNDWMFQTQNLNQPSEIQFPPSPPPSLPLHLFLHRTVLFISLWQSQQLVSPSRHGAAKFLSFACRCGWLRESSPGSCLSMRPCQHEARKAALIKEQSEPDELVSGLTPWIWIQTVTFFPIKARRLFAYSFLISLLLLREQRASLDRI